MLGIASASSVCRLRPPARLSQLALAAVALSASQPFAVTESDDAGTAQKATGDTAAVLADIFDGISTLLDADLDVSI